MKKFIIIVLVILLMLSAGVVYVNRVILPVKVKSMFVGAIEKQTGKKVLLKSLQFSIFKGFILRDLVIMDDQQVLLSARQASCAVFFWPIFKKKIIIPSIDIKAPFIFLERRKDNTFNLQELFGANTPEAKKPEFNVIVYKINVSSGTMVFQDDTLSAPFTKEINNIRMDLHLKLPLGLAFNFKGDLPAEPLIGVSVKGEYKLLSRELVANISVKNLAPGQFRPYYGASKMELVSGLVDMQGQLNLKDQLLRAQINGRGDNLVFTKDNLKITLSPVLQIKLEYDQKVKKLKLDGYCDVEQAGISGIEFLGEVKELHGKVVFNQDSLFADSLKAELMGLPFEINLGVKDFATPIFNISTSFNLGFLPGIAKEKFNFIYVNSAKGKASLAVKLYPDNKGVWQVQGSADIAGGALRLGKQDVPVENISGKMEFSRQGLSWWEGNFKYLGTDYQTNGKLADFSSPSLEIKLFAKDLSLTGNFTAAGKKIKVGSLKGKYLNSEFSASGNIDNSDGTAKADLLGNIALNLEDLSPILDKRYPGIKSMRPSGGLKAQFNLAGSLYDLKNCFIGARFNSDDFSLYGLHSRAFSLDYLQEQKLSRIVSSRIALYDGEITAAATMNLDTVNFPYHIEMQAVGINLAKLKADTPARNKDISGKLECAAKLNGFSTDLSKLSGSGNLRVSEGKLWELNFFQGIGKLLFAKDFGSITLSECSADFLINNSFIYTDSPQFRSNIADLSGPVKIGFNGSLEAAFDVAIKSDQVPLSGTLKDIAAVIVGQAGKFGVIKLSGTIQDPKYVFKPAVTDIIKGIADTFFGRGQ